MVPGKILLCRFGIFHFFISSDCDKQYELYKPVYEKIASGIKWIRELQFLFYQI